MTVSGLGTARTPYPPLTPLHRAHRAEKPAARSDFDSLTGADRELIFHVTGQRVGPGFDPAKEHPTAFAAIIAAERAAGRLAPGQEVSALYLKDLNRRYERTGGPNAVAPYLGKALDYFRGTTAARRIDVSA
ncbi:hypothetical protein Ade02nite_45120 [Paractinoplanes deccanensis]|uniref:Uncharacterized protein n=1 Tax=Paractinoplanes deccanensis TaxID=113561 RepID=A0ABQ3Y7B4_9ACTN|nr:hypothetical protein [Actinoplanes deccanensis]GID75871.1 hypothetical protein Ade02nite_45120 [Actinoplanes deccanensis]